MKFIEFPAVLVFVTVTLACGKKKAETTEPPPVEEIIEAATVRESEASRSGSSSVSAAEIRQFTEQVFQLETNSVYSHLTLDRQGNTTDVSTSDAAPKPLFAFVSSEALWPETSRLMTPMLDNYIVDVGSPEVMTHEEVREKDVFLNALVSTPIMQKTEDFLKSKGLINEGIRPVLDRLWFTMYSRLRNQIGSSGFEHVFLGELKRGEVTGFHSWLYFLREEKAGRLDYQGYMTNVQFGNKGEVLKIRFKWLNHSKPYGSMFIGTSPELEMAIYTVCFYVRMNKNCGISFGKQKFSVKVYSQNYRGLHVIGSAFPSLY